jgi:hypothetical protein
MIRTTLIGTAIGLVLAATHAASAGATDYCRDFTRGVQSGNDALYQGFVYGYVMGWTRNRNPIAARAVAEQVSRMTLKYCVEKPGDDMTSVVALWTEVVVGSLK